MKYRRRTVNAILRSKIKYLNKKFNDFRKTLRRFYTNYTIQKGWKIEHN